jgi:hypothetical protein
MSDTYYLCDECGYRVDCPDGKVLDCPSCYGIITAPILATKRAQIATNVPTIDNIHLDFASYKQISDNKVSFEEYERYQYLYALQANGIISQLECQVSYELLPSVHVPGINWYTYKRDSRGTRQGFKQAGMSYAPDFRYQYQGVTVIEEYKAVRKTESKLTHKINYLPVFQAGYRHKLKLWVAKYGFQLVSGEWFFCLTGWNRFEDMYSAFDSNSNLIDYPLANYIQIAQEQAA